jgi:superfamily II DNA or RNA helicase
VGQKSAFEKVLESLGQESFSKGTKFERVLKWWLQNDYIWSKELLPESVKLWEESTFRTGPDIGIDLTATDIHGNIWAIQAKNWNPDVVLPKSEIDKFLTASNTKIFHKRLLVTTTNVISTNALRAINEQEKPVVVVSKANLEDSEIWELFNDSFRSAKAVPKKKLFPHQSEAIKAVTASFKLNTRGQLLMACGSGKTITAQRIQEKLDSDTTLILLPSLLLVEQTLKSWRAEASQPFLALSVCSDSSVNGDEPLSKTSDLPFPVTTDPNEIRKFLQLSGKKVIFSTYQSSQKIEEAVKGKKFQFDLVICDEAHRLAGKVDKAYGTVFREGAIPSRRYLFMTATPKIFSSRLKVQVGENDIEIHSMDDEQKFGPVFYNFSFAKAIDADVLTDYKVIVMGVDDSSIMDLVENRQFIDFQDTTLDASTLAAHFGVAKAMKTYSIKRVISFHSRVERAKEFATTHKIVVSHMLGEPTSQILSEAISGKDTVFRRKQLLDRLRDLDGVDFGIVTNAKCLTEGVDVPSLDGVAFVDPRSSQVDIVQAVGRAIRKGGKDKSVGFIILPVFFSSKNLDEQTIDESQFAPVWSVLNALKSHDSNLEEEINSLRRGLGQKKPKAELPSKIIFDLPLGFPLQFADKIRTYLLEKTSSIWEEWFARLEIFINESGHCRPKRESPDEEERLLGGWVQHQRHLFNKGKLQQERLNKLEALELWTWDPLEDQWLESYEKVKNFAEQNGSSRVPSTYHDPDGRPLGKWVAGLRGKKDSLSKEQVTLLESLPDWTWDPFSEQWNASAEYLEKVAQKTGPLSFTRKDKFPDGRNIGIWMQSQRTNRLKLSLEKTARLEAIPGWRWVRSDFEANVDGLLQLAGQDGNIQRVTGNNREFGDLDLWTFIQTQRQKYRIGKLEEWEVKTLQGIPGWVWNAKDDEWEKLVGATLSFIVENERLPKKGESQQDLAVGRFVSRHRSYFRSGSLPKDKAERLARLPKWSWETGDEEWNLRLSDVKDYFHKTGKLPTTPVAGPNGARMDAWLYQQRKNWDKLEANQRKQLQELKGFVPLKEVPSSEDTWRENLKSLNDFVERNGKLPRYRAKETPPVQERKLALWLRHQTNVFDKLGAVQKRALSNVKGFKAPNKTTRGG